MCAPRSMPANSAATSACSSSGRSRSRAGSRINATVTQPPKCQDVTDGADLRRRAAEPEPRVQPHRFAEAALRGGEGDGEAAHGRNARDVHARLRQPVRRRPALCTRPGGQPMVRVRRQSEARALARDGVRSVVRVVHQSRVVRQPRGLVQGPEVVHLHATRAVRFHRTPDPAGSGDSDPCRASS